MNIQILNDHIDKYNIYRTNILEYCPLGKLSRGSVDKAINT